MLLLCSLYHQGTVISKASYYYYHHHILIKLYASNQVMMQYWYMDAMKSSVWLCLWYYKWRVKWYPDMIMLFLVTLHLHHFLPFQCNLFILIVSTILKLHFLGRQISMILWGHNSYTGHFFCFKNCLKLNVWYAWKE